MEPKNKVSLKDVATLARVSPSTVSHVLNGTRIVNEDTARRVREAIDRLGYRTNYVAKMLRQRRSNCVGVLVCDISHDYFSSVIRGIENVLNAHNYNIILSDSHEDVEKERKQLDVFLSMQVDGIICSPTRRELVEVEKSYYMGCPFVAIDRVPDVGETDSVIPGSEISSYEITKDLIARGHRRIIFATARAELFPNTTRLAGHKRALKELGVEYDPSLFHLLKPTVESGEELIQWALYQTDATALMVNNLHASAGVMKYVTEKCIDIPAKMSIIGFDDSIWTSTTVPQLSTVHTHSQEIGSVAAKLLLARIENPQKGIENIVIPNKIIMRGTT